MAAFAFGGTAVDRAGGLLVLSGVASRIVERAREFELEIVEIPPTIHQANTVLALIVVVEGRPTETLRDVVLASSSAIRDDQERLLREDLAELEVILRSEVYRLTLEREPESVKRAMAGDR